MATTHFVTDIEERKKIVYGHDLKDKNNNPKTILIKIAKLETEDISNKVDINLDRICAYWYYFTLTNTIIYEDNKILINYKSTKDAFKSCYMSFLQISELYYNVKKAKNFNPEQLEKLKLLLNEMVEFFTKYNECMNKNYHTIFIRKNKNIDKMGVDEIFKHKKSIELLLNSLFIEIVALKGLYNIFSNDTYKVNVKKNFLFKKNHYFVHESLTFLVIDYKYFSFFYFYISYNNILQNILKKDKNNEQFIDTIENAINKIKLYEKKIIFKWCILLFVFSLTLVFMGWGITAVNSYSKKK